MVPADPEPKQGEIGRKKGNNKVFGCEFPCGISSQSIFDFMAIDQNEKIPNQIHQRQVVHSLFSICDAVKSTPNQHRKYSIE